MRSVTVLAAMILSSASTTAAAQGVVVNEVMYRPWNQGTTGVYEFIEIYNDGDTDVDLGGFWLTDSQDLDGICADVAPLDREGAFEVPAGTTIAAGSYLTFWHTAIPGVTDQPGNIVFGGSVSYWNLVLNDLGDQVTLFHCDGVTPIVTDSLDYDTLGVSQTPRNVSLERIDPSGTTQDASNWGFSLVDAGGPIYGGGYTPGGTPGAQNTLTGP